MYDTTGRHITIKDTDDGYEVLTNTTAAGTLACISDALAVLIAETAHPGEATNLLNKVLTNIQDQTIAALDTNNPHH